MANWLNIIVTIVILTSPVRCFGVEVQFDDLLKNPSRFNRQRVSVTGLLEVAGDNNYLWRDTESRKRQNFKSSIFVMNDMGRPSYPGTNLSIDAPMNYRWAKVTGMINTSLHGRWGEEPFVLIQEKIVALPKPREKQFLAIQGWFRNDTGRDVQMDIVTGGWEESFTLGPGAIAPVTIVHNRGTAIANNKSANIFAKCRLPPQSRRFYDSRRKFYFYRVLRDRIEPVLPQDTKGWRLMMPDRD